MTKRDIYEPRDNKPFEYPEAIDLMERLNHTYWLHSEVTFIADMQDMSVLPQEQREGIIRNLLCISTIEVAVKKFWTQLGSHFPKIEWDMLGTTAGESENRHYMAYSQIISKLGLDDRLELVKDVPAVKGRFEYLNKYLKLSPHNADPKKYIIKLILFSCLMEHTSLFGQFVPLMYFYKRWGKMKDIRNIIKWTAVDEVNHFMIGATIVNILREEHPEYFDKELNDLIRKACAKSIKYEKNILDWIWEQGELEGLTKDNILSFMKHQVNMSLERMGFDKCFDDVGDLKPTEFFNAEIFADANDDFFAVRVTDYTVKDKAITANDLF